MNQLTEALHNISGAQHQYEVFTGANTHTPYLADTRQKYQRKLFDTLDEVLSRCDLRDGMTVSFHHAFREGDQVINYVMARLAEKGLRGLTLASSSLMTCNAPLIEHIKHGVISKIYTSGMRGELADAISHGLMEEPVQIHSHGGRVNLIEKGEINIDVAFLAVSCCDEYGNASGSGGKSRCGSLGYAMVDAKYADQVVIITDTLVPYPNTPISIPQTDVDYVVEIDAIGDPDGIAKGATRFTKNPKELLIAEYAAKIITHSPYYKEGFSFQTGTGGSSLAVTRFMREQMLKDGIKASFALGGITNAMVELLEEGLVEKIIDVQDFDHPSAISLGENANHYEIDANMYASPLSKGAVINQLDTAILSALEVDTDFNVNVITGSDGVIRGASGGHSDTSMACKMSLVIAPLVRGRIPTIVEQVNTVVTPGTSVDVVVTEVGIAINPKRTDLIDCFKTLDVPQFTLEELKDKAYNIVGTPEPIKYGDKVVALIEYRDGSLIDVVRNV